MIIVVAISAISSFVFSYNSIVNLIRFYRFFILVLAAFFGLFGLFIGLSILIINISSVTSFGYSYTYPFDPLVKEEIKDSIIKINKNKNSRNPLLTKRTER
jgi:spore germination protein KA